MDQMTVEQARTLFPEAKAWHLGESRYLPENSEIRKIARRTYGHDFVTHLDRVCVDIFFTLASHA